LATIKTGKRYIDPHSGIVYEEKVPYTAENFALYGQQQ